jgi:hypothetical protein
LLQLRSRIMPRAAGTAAVKKQAAAGPSQFPGTVDKN